jgi:hypothetical protein
MTDAGASDGLMGLIWGSSHISVLSIVNPRGKAFLDHWHALPRRAGLITPHCQDYLDHAPAALMPTTFIQEVLDDGLLVRFMGTELVTRWRRDDTGKVFGAHLSEADRAHTVSAGKTVTNHPCGMLQHGVMGTSQGRTAIFEAILLPLAVEAERPKRIVVFSTLIDPLGREEHGQKFSAAGKRCWIDIGAGVPSTPPAPNM